MSELLPAVVQPGALVTPADTYSVPVLIPDAGEPAGWRYVEFFTVNINNPHTRRAYVRRARGSSPGVAEREAGDDLHRVAGRGGSATLLGAGLRAAAPPGYRGAGEGVMTARPVPARHWRCYGNDPLPSGREALEEPFRAFPSWFMRITCDRCGKDRMLNEAYTPQCDG